MSDILLIPILNKQVSLFSGPTFFISDNFYIEKLTDEEHSAFFRDASSFKDNLSLKSTKCIKIKNLPVTDRDIANVRTKTTFLLNLFSNEVPIVTLWCGHINGDKKLHLRKIFEFESLAAFNKIQDSHFKLLKHITRAAFIQMFQVIENALAQNTTSLFTLEKYNSARLRDNFLDKLLDATICFETMTPGNVELVFRLSQNIAFIVGNTPAERLSIFEEMKILYDVRSKLVHGDLNQKSQQKIEEVKGKWTNYEKYLKSAVTYYLIFLSQKSKNDWEQHLKELVLGTQDKITQYDI